MQVTITTAGASTSNKDVCYCLRFHCSNAVSRASLPSFCAAILPALHNPSCHRSGLLRRPQALVMIHFVVVAFALLHADVCPRLMAVAPSDLPESWCSTLPSEWQVFLFQPHLLKAREHSKVPGMRLTLGPARGAGAAAHVRSASFPVWARAEG